MNVFISVIPATDPPVQDVAAPQSVPPAEGQPVSDMMLFLGSVLKPASLFCQKDHVQDAAIAASTPAKNARTLGITLFGAWARAAVQLSPRSEVATGRLMPIVVRFAFTPVSMFSSSVSV